MLYERGNAAKQWIFTELDRLFSTEPAMVLDLGCGDGHLWKTFLEAHPSIVVHGVDTDAEAIRRGRTFFDGNGQITLAIVDAQHPVEGCSVDVVVAFSAIEHVVDRDAFLRTVWEALDSGGVAYLNYDVGHFRSSNVKERLMVPVSQLLAVFGIEGPYMKCVNDRLFQEQAKELGFVVEAVRKHNMFPLKGFMKGASDDAVREWYAFEERIAKHVSVDKLDQVMWSTTVVLKKP